MRLSWKCGHSGAGPDACAYHWPYDLLGVVSGCTTPSPKETFGIVGERDQKGSFRCDRNVSTNRRTHVFRGCR